MSPSKVPPRIIWWPALVLLGFISLTLAITLLDPTRSFQQRNLTFLGIAVGYAPLLLIWWGILSNAPRAWRLTGVFTALSVVALVASSFRVTGVSGDLRPILESRWMFPRTNTRNPPDAAAPAPSTVLAPAVPRAFPHFLGPHADLSIRGIRLQPDWETHPPALLWRQPVGPAWSGFVVSNGLAFTQEQDGDQESVCALDLLTGNRVWEQRHPGRYATTIAGEGPRSSPTLANGRLFTLGATGTLSAFSPTNGTLLWRVSLTELANSRVPEWGFASAPLVVSNQVIVLAGGPKPVRSFDVATGNPLWASGDAGSNYGSVSLVEIHGTPQLLFFGSRSINALDPADGRILWKHPFGTGMPLVAHPILIPPNRIVVSAGYGVGAELIELSRTNATDWVTQSVWASKRLKAKFANPVRLGDALYGLDDGILAGIRLESGESLWKEGRWGHGQGLLIDDLHLLMAESGELVLLQPTPTGPNLRSRFPVFTAKTWNPIALAGDLLLVRNDREAACLRLATLPAKPSD